MSRSLFVGCALLGCSAAAPSSLELWDAYVNDTTTAAVTQGGLQPACVPQRLAAAAGVPFAGTAVLFHGFSACPQQHLRMAPLLAAEGFDVLMPLTPGHGNALPGPDAPAPPRWPPCIHGCGNSTTPRDNVNGLPDDPAQYDAFVKRMGAIAAASSGTRVVSGLSLGGTLAAAAGQLRGTDGKAVFARQLIFNPLLKLSNNFEDLLARFMNNQSLTKHMWAGWGDECYNERSLGRGGFCMFPVAQAMAAHDFGTATLNAAAPPPGAVVVSAYDQGDPVVSTPAVRQLAARLGAQQHCVLNFTEHSMLSLYDEPGTNKWYTNELSCDAVRFLAHGTVFVEDAAVNPAEGSDHYCHLDCSSTTCPLIYRGGAVPALTCPPKGSYACPANSYVSSARWPIQDFSDCSCSWGYEKVKDECKM